MTLLSLAEERQYFHGILHAVRNHSDKGGGQEFFVQAKFLAKTDTYRSKPDINLVLYRQLRL